MLSVILKYEKKSKLLHWKSRPIQTLFSKMLQIPEIEVSFNVWNDQCVRDADRKTSNYSHRVCNGEVECAVIESTCHMKSGGWKGNYGNEIQNKCIISRGTNDGRSPDQKCVILKCYANVTHLCGWRCILHPEPILLHCSATCLLLL